MALRIRLLVVLLGVILFIGACFPSFSGAIRTTSKSPDINLGETIEERHLDTHLPGVIDLSLAHRSLRGTGIIDFSAFSSEETKEFNPDYTPSHPNDPSPHDGPPPPQMLTEVINLDDTIDYHPVGPNPFNPHDVPPPPHLGRLNH